MGDPAKCLKPGQKPKLLGRKKTKPGDWLKKRMKASAMRQSVAHEALNSTDMVAVLLEDYPGEYDPMHAGGPSDPWRQAGFGPIPGMDVEGEVTCPSCQGKGADAAGEPCPECEGTGQVHGLEGGEDQLNTPGTDPTADLEAPGGAPSPTHAQAPGVQLPKYGNRMQWRPQESLARRLLGGA